MAKETKTNAMRILDKNHIAYAVFTYDCDGFMDGVTVANSINQPLEKVFKTLVAQGKGREYFVFVIPVADELDLKKAAASVHEKFVELIAVKDINAVTGYIRGGCSPIGMKKLYKTVVHQSAAQLDRILFSGGRPGAQIEMSPADLAAVIPVLYEDLIVRQRAYPLLEDMPLVGHGSPVLSLGTDRIASD